MGEAMVHCYSEIRKIKNQEGKSLRRRYLWTLHVFKSVKASIRDSSNDVVREGVPYMDNHRDTAFTR